MRGKILIADDEPGIVAFVHRHLENEGYEILVAADGDDYITKPFGIKELDARIGTHLRRERRRRVERTRVSFGRITIDYRDL